MASTFAADVLAVTRLGPKYLILHLQPQQAFKHAAGQHTVVSLQDQEGSFERHYSIASAARVDGSFDLCLLTLGDKRAGALLTRLKKGDQLMVSHPRGNFVLSKDHPKEKIFIAGGSGIAPLRAMMQELTQHWQKPFAHPAKLIYGCEDFMQVPYYSELFNFAAQPHHNFTMWVYATHGAVGAGLRGLVTDKIPEVIINNASYYLCGPPAMQQAARAILLRHHIPVTLIFSEL